MKISTNTPLDNLLGTYAELPEEVAQSLSEEGYVILPNLADEETLETIRKNRSEPPESFATTGEWKIKPTTKKTPVSGWKMTIATVESTPRRT